MEDKKNGEMICCAVCKFVTRRDLMRSHIIRSHYNNEAVEQRPQSLDALSRIDAAQPIKTKADPKVKKEPKVVKADPIVKEKPKVVEDKKSGELIRCEVCKFVTRRDHMRRHIVTAHGGDDVSLRTLRKAEVALKRIDVAQPVEGVSKVKAKPTSTQRAFTDQPSTGFVDEALHISGAQRHNKDSISLRPSQEVFQLTQERQNLNCELAALEKRKKEQAQQERIARAANKSAQGLAKVVVGCVVTLCYTDENEVVSYYVLSDKLRGYQGKIPVYVENYDMPPYGADECLRADADLAKAMIGLFVGDEKEARISSGVLKYRVVSVTNHQTGDKPNQVASAPHRGVSEGQTHTWIGSETYAFLARDSGKFGSFVSHDDYSDEADAEVHGAEAYDNENKSGDD